MQYSTHTARALFSKVANIYNSYINCLQTINKKFQKIVMKYCKHKTDDFNNEVGNLKIWANSKKSEKVKRDWRELRSSTEKNSWIHLPTNMFVKFCHMPKLSKSENEVLFKDMNVTFNRLAVLLSFFQDAKLIVS